MRAAGTYSVKLWVVMGSIYSWPPGMGDIVDIVYVAINSWRRQGKFLDAQPGDRGCKEGRRRGKEEREGGEGSGPVESP